MWLTFIIAFIVFVFAALALATGLLISGKTIKGSCGGINCGLCKGKSAACKQTEILRDKTAD